MTIEIKTGNLTLKMGPDPVTSIIDDARSFIADLVIECAEKGISVILQNTDGVDLCGTTCSGYFDPENKKLVTSMATGIDEWFPILLHEYSHMQQWLDDPVKFDELNKFDTVLSKWVAGTLELGAEDIKKYFADAMYLEGDCEKRTVELIKRRSIGINIEEYSQKAMAYVNMYHVLPNVRKWPHPTKAPYRLEKVWGLFPKIVDLNWKPKNIHIKAYMENCFE
jgi:hypothetical protein